MRFLLDRFRASTGFLLAVLLICNAYTVASRLLPPSSEGWRGELGLFMLVGLVLQLPLLIAFALPYTVVDSLGRSPGARWLALVGVPAEALLLFLGLAFYLGSEGTYRFFNAYVGFDVYGTILVSPRQLFLKTLHDYPLALPALLAVCLATAVLRRWRPRQVDAWVAQRPGGRSWSAGARVVSVLAAVAVLALPIFYGWDGPTALLVRQHSFPTTFASLDWVGSLRRSRERYALSEVGPGSLVPIEPLAEWARRAGAPVRKPNVFLIMLEAVSSDHVGFNGYFRQDITPSLDALYADSLTFVNAYAVSNHSNYAQTSIYSSQYPLRRDRLDMFERIDYPKTLLFDLLAAYGYETALISSQNEDWQGMRRFLETSSRIDHFYHAPDAAGERAGLEMKLDDAFTRKRAQEYIASRESEAPLLLAMNWQRTHFPYALPRGAETPYLPIDAGGTRLGFFRYPKEKVGIVRNRFDNALRYVDGQLGLFLSFLKQRGLYENSIVIVVPDHGEAFYEKGFPSHGTSLYDDQIKTFVMVKAPESRIRGRQEEGISLVDVVPMVLELLGLPNHPNLQGKRVIGNRFRERNLFVTSQGVITANAVVQHPWKLIRTRGIAPKLVNAEFDPSERRDLSEDYPVKRLELDAVLDHYVRSQLGYYEGHASGFYPPQY